MESNVAHKKTCFSEDLNSCNVAGDNQQQKEPDAVVYG